MVLRICLLCFFIAQWSAAPLPSQSAPSDSTKPVVTIRTKVQRVMVDIVVTNDKGEAVTGLPKEDFQVLEDGKAQTIDSFEEHHGTPMKQISLPPMPPHVYTNFPLTQSADAVNVLLLDALNTPSRDQVYVHSQMIKYLKTIPAGTRVAIFTLASRLRMLQGITSDSSHLLAALNTSQAGTQASPLLHSDAENQADQRRIQFLEENEQMPPPTTMAQALVDPILAAKQFMADTAAQQTQERIGITLEALQQLARYLTGVPGRKNVIWFSGAFPVNVFPDPDVPDAFTIAKSFQDEIRKTADLMSTSRTAVYPIAAEGLLPDSVFEANASEIAEKRPSLQMQDQVKELQNRSVDRDLNHRAMEELAKDTGGQAYYNTNGLGDALARVVNNGTRYYSVTYNPANATMDGKFRQIQVKLVHEKYSLAYRRGYYADDLGTELSAAKKPDSDPLLPLMSRNLPDYTQILFKLLAQPSNPQPAAGAPRAGNNPNLKEPVTRYGVDFAIAASDLRLDAAPDGARHGNIEVVLVAYDGEGRPVNYAVTNGNLVLPPDVYANVQRGGIPIHKEIDVPKGCDYLRAGLYDLNSNLVGTLGIPLASPHPAAH